ncbi:MAG: tol-pal system protein YbgF [Enterobacterales bacterium]|jgi:tol-pal system protein YbgF
MNFDQIKASCSYLSKIGKVGSFSLFVLFGNSYLAAEVTRSLSLEDRVRILEQQLTSANRMRAESQFEITSLKNEVRDLLGVVEEQGYQLQQIITRQRELYRDIDNRLNEAESANDTDQTSASQVTQSQSSQPQSSQPQSSQPQSNTTNTDSTVSAHSTTPVVDASDDVQIRKIYDGIFPLVKSKRYDDAIAGYKQFIADYPNSNYVANSRYWLAQIYVVQGNTDDAEREYLIVAQEHSTSSKAVEAWLKLGKLYERLGQSEKAVNAYNQVVTQYGDSTAAQMAVDRLQALKSR